MFVALLCFAASAGCVFISRRWFGSAFAPFGVLITVWTFCLGSIHLGFIEYERLRAETMLIYFGTLFAFAIGCLVVKKRFGSHIDSSQPEISQTLIAQLRLTVFITFAFCLIGNVFYYRELDSLIGINSLWVDPTAVRFEESVGDLRRSEGFTLSFLRIFTLPSFVFAIFYLQVAKARERLWLFVIIAVDLFAELLGSGRTGMFTALSWGGLSLIYFRMSLGRALRFSWQKLCIVICLFILLVAYFQFTSTRLEKDVSADEENVVHLPAAFEGLDNLLLYSTCGLVAFQEMLAEPNFFPDNGNLTFGFASRILNQLMPDRFRYPEYVHPFIDIPFPINVFTYLDAYFLDFGYAGLVIFPPLIGAVCTLLYYLALRKPAPFLTYLAALYGCCCFNSTLINRFGTFEIFIYVALILPIYLAAGFLVRRSGAADAIPGEEADAVYFPSELETSDRSGDLQVRAEVSNEDSLR
jgi:oligosaccharide repeat unit polymerase